MSSDIIEFVDAPSEEVATPGEVRYSDVVLHATDWTTETVVGQLRRGNIILNPRFQRRDAWDRQRKSQFIESLILGLPIPQIVLAELKEKRGSFIVLDGKQRLLSLLQFWGLGDGDNNSYPLSGLEVRENLLRKKFYDLESDPEFADDYNALLNQPIRTVVIKNWPDVAFLHLVFLRLNTGSVKLSPQELRQALFPGNFTDFVDDRSVQSTGIQKLLGLRRPDYRMRDVELLARFLAFHFFLGDYRSRMKAFLDNTFERLNGDWETKFEEIEAASDAFDGALVSLMELFGDSLARKPSSRQINRAILDALVFYSIDKRIQMAMKSHKESVLENYQTLFEDHGFVSAIERDTASVFNTATRLRKWGEALQRSTGLEFEIPELIDDRIVFNGFWR